ncbi:MAG: O-antigen ligase family protein [Candidatus Moranbacteria bacterium]|nr:O-antigen ligase family protein [Candidatus Moranbacteria bacterium]
MFKEFLFNLKNILKKELVLLWIFSVALGFALIVFADKNKLPLGAGDFVFFAILALLVALYRPRWIFFLFVSLLPLENIIFISGFLPLQLRPYQFLGAELAVAVIVLWFFKRLSFKLQKPTWIDWLVFSLVPLGFLSVINSPINNISLKNSLILFSFVILYYLVRNFLRNRNDLLKAASFFIGSSLVVLSYGFWQVFADKFGARSFEVMFGRPNSTFTEADWLGIFLCFSLAVLLPAINYFETRLLNWKYIVYIVIFFNLTLLILTLSRSAWIGAAIVIFFWLVFNLYRKSEIRTSFTPRKFANSFVIIFLIFLVSLIAIHFGKLSKFDIFDRARSAATSEQKITVACDNDSNIPAIISDTNELAKYNCKFINLEEINYYKLQGKIVAEIFRKDPNVMTRSQIYRKSFEIIREHPVLGVGFGTITEALGSDERGAGLNESNVFLQVWASSGILGLVAFAAVIIYLFVYSFRRISPICPLNRIIGCSIVRDDFEKNLNIFMFLGLLALLIPNLFNAGLLMGIFWLELAVFVSISKTENK